MLWRWWWRYWCHYPIRPLQFQLKHLQGGAVTSYGNAGGVNNNPGAYQGMAGGGGAGAVVVRNPNTSGNGAPGGAGTIIL